MHILQSQPHPSMLPIQCSQNSHHQVGDPKSSSIHPEHHSNTQHHPAKQTFNATPNSLPSHALPSQSIIPHTLWRSVWTTPQDKTSEISQHQTRPQSSLSQGVPSSTRNAHLCNLLNQGFCPRLAQLVAPTNSQTHPTH